MKRIIFNVLVIIFSLSASSAVVAGSRQKSNSENSALLIKKENKLSKEELKRIANRVEKIRHIDRSKMTSEKMHELRQELREDRELWHKDFHGGI